MIERLVIVGAGGFGREVLNWVAASTSWEWSTIAFLDANRAALDAFVGYPPVIGDPTSYLPEAHDRFVIGVGQPSLKERLCMGLQSRGAEFITIIHPTAVVGSQSKIGRGVVLCPYAVVTANATIGDFVMLNLAATVGHDAAVGDWSTLSCHADVTGHALVGKRVLLGSHAAVLPGKRVGDGAIVGAGSVVVRNVPPNSTVFGVPATVIDSRE